MGNARVDPRVQHGQQFLKALEDAAKSKEFAGGRLFATQNGKQTSLFVRSRLADGLMKVFMPERRAMQKQLAYQALFEALSDGFPGMAAHDLLSMAGIHHNASIRVDLFRSFAKKAQAYINARAREDAQVAIKENKLNLQGWRVAPTPGLEALSQLSHTDLKTWQRHDKSGAGEGFIAFRQFACAAAGLPTLEMVSADQFTRKAVEFMSGWTRLPAAGKSALLEQLSMQGRLAFKAIDALVPKAIEALRLPVAGGLQFGLTSPLADKQDARAAFAQVARALVLPSEGEVRECMILAADQLGKLIGDAMRDAKSESAITQPTRLRNAVREFLDRHVNPAVGSTDIAKQKEAIRDWVIKKDAFLERTCNTALRTLLLKPEVQIDNGKVGIGDKTYAVGEELGKGGEGVVYAARDLSNSEAVAIKTLNVEERGIIPPSCSPREAVMHQMAAAIGSPHLLGFRGAASTTNGGLRVAMELAPHGSLHDVIEKLAAGPKGSSAQAAPSPQQIQLARHALRSIATGLRDMHGAGLLHRDMKGGNIFICADGVLKIGDFGKTVLTSENITVGRPADAPQWLPPEFSRGAGYTEFTPGADLWSMAIVVFELATGMLPPIVSGGPVEAFEKLDGYFNNATMLDPEARQKALGLDVLHQSDPELAKLLVDLLHPKPDMRPGAEAVLGRIPTTDDSKQMGQLLIDLSKA